MNRDPGIVYDGHARRQMQERRITEAQVESVLAAYHTSYPAEPLPRRPERSIVYVGAVGGRDLKVYVLEESDPPYIKTVVWKGEEQG